MFNNATPTVSTAAPEVTTPVVNPDAWKKAYVPGSLVEITPDTLASVWADTRRTTLVGEYWVKPNIPLNPPTDFNMAINYLVELGPCFCRYHIGEQSEHPPDLGDSIDDGLPRNQPYWVDLSTSGCVAIASSEDQNHNKHWWRGVEIPTVKPIDGNDENNQKHYSEPICETYSPDTTSDIVDLGDLHDQGSGQ